MEFKFADKDVKLEGKALLDYDIRIQPLSERDRIYYWEGTGSNYSIAGFEMLLYRHKLRYIIQYYVTSGLLVLISWVN